MRLDLPIRHATAAVLGLTLAVCATPPPAAAELASPPPPGPAAPPAPLPPHRSPKELADAIAAAPERFAIREVSSVAEPDAAAQLWPLRGRFFDEPVVLHDEKGAPYLAARTLAPETVPLLQAAEAHFRAERYDEALPLYEQAAAKDPACYSCWNGAGDCHYFSGRPTQALRSYRKATDADPFGHRSWFYAGKIMAGAGYPEDAQRLLGVALSLRPDWKTLLDFASRYADDLKAEVHPEPLLVPQGTVRQEGEKVTIVVASGAPPHWRTYLQCKALWRVEPGACDVCPPGGSAGFRAAEERECVAALLDAYARRPAPIAADPRLDRLASVVRDGLLEGFLLYELAPRNVPSATLLVDRNGRVLVNRYVTSYVLVPRQR